MFGYEDIDKLIKGIGTWIVIGLLLYFPVTLSMKFEWGFVGIVVIAVAQIVISVAVIWLIFAFIEKRKEIAKSRELYRKYGIKR